MRQHLEAARPNVTRFFDKGLPFKIKVQCTWDVADREGNPVGYPMHLTSRAMDVLNGEQSLTSWGELVTWLIRQQDLRQEVAENYDRIFSGVKQVIIHIHPGQQMLAAAEEIDLANLEPPEPEGEDWGVSDFVKLPDSLIAKRACINIRNEDCRSFQYSVVCFLEKTWKRRGACKVSKYIVNWPKDGVFSEGWAPSYGTLGLDFSFMDTNSQNKNIFQGILIRFHQRTSMLLNMPLWRTNSSRPTLATRSGFISGRGLRTGMGM